MNPIHTPPQRRIRLGLIGWGKAGQAVARAIGLDDRYELAWVARRQVGAEPRVVSGDRAISAWALSPEAVVHQLEHSPVDAVIDFSSRESVHTYGPACAERSVTVVSAVSAYEAEDLESIRAWARCTRVMASPNITLGINFLLVAAKLLQRIAPFADVEILEQHFKQKPEVSGTAKRLAATLELPDDRITSLRLGGIVGHHEVIFGFPFQTVRLVHESIGREAFGTGALYAVGELLTKPPGFYTFDDLLQDHLRRAVWQPDAIVG